MARQLKPFVIYAATAPSGRAYVGLTSMGVTKRWGAHVSRARRAGKGNVHPLVAAILKYGPENFDVRVVQDGLTKEEAASAEKAWIIRLGTLAPSGYNISEGGETDGVAGAAAFRALLADPAWRVAYLEKLSEACKDRTFPADASDLAIAWRRANPQAAWKTSFRASRVALRGFATGERVDPRFGPWGRLVIASRRVAAARRSRFARGTVAAIWEGRDANQRQVIGAKIAATLTAHHAVNPEAIRATLVETRAKIDRKHQGARASAGLKQWWAELRQDPARYAAYIESRARRKVQP